MARIRRTNNFIEIRGLNYYREMQRLKRMGIILLFAPFVIFVSFALTWSALMGGVLAVGLVLFLLLAWYAKNMGYIFRFRMDRESMEWCKLFGLIRKEVRFKDVQYLKLVHLRDSFQYASKGAFDLITSVKTEIFWIWQLVAVLDDGSDQLIIEEPVPDEMKNLGNEFIKIMNVELVESTMETI